MEKTKIEIKPNSGRYDLNGTYIFDSNIGVITLSRESCTEVFLTWGDNAPLPFDRDDMYYKIDDAYEQREASRRELADYVDAAMATA